MRLSRVFSLLAIASLVLTACGGGGAGGTVPSAGGGGGGGTQTAQQQTTSAVSAANAAGAPVANVTSFESAITNPSLPLGTMRRVAFGAVRAGSSPSPSPSPGGSPMPTPPPAGTCVANFLGGNSPFAGFEFWTPDKAGDANSVEYEFFYDAGCTQPAKDIVRIHTLSGSTQTQTVTITQWAQGSTTPTRIVTENSTITGQFDSEGFPVLSSGFTRTTQRTVSANGQVVMTEDSEFIAQAASGSSIAFCGDSAGFNNATLQSINGAEGWQNLLAQGTRTQNSDGSVTWSTTNAAGSTYSATAASAFTINKGSANSACPITTPEFTLGGGTLVSSFGVASMTVTFKDDDIVHLAIVNATLSNGLTLNATSNDPAVAPSSSGFITGTLANSSGTVATFSVNAEGDGTLTVTATGTTFQMEDWHVVKDESEHSPSPSPSSSASPEPSASASASPAASPTPTPTHT